MKRKIFTLAIALFSAAGASAQLDPGSIAPDFTLKDLNGTDHHLYDYLQQGKTVFIDVSAAWCAPCWGYHSTHALSDIYKQHGPTGFPNVNAGTTNDVMVIWVEGETTNTTAQLHGPVNLSGSYATQTQGDWVTGTPFPIVDANTSITSAFKTAWKIGYFPTIYMICRDRIVQEVGQLSAAALYAASQAGCPNYAPSSTVDAKAVIPYTTGSFYVCNANPIIKFQNYSATNSITAATINVYSGSTLVKTHAWTGPAVPPYGVASVTIPGFAGTSFVPYKYEVIVAGDSKATNNMSKDSLFKVYAASNAVATPWTENFEASSAMPFKMTSSQAELRTFQSQGSYTLKGVNGATTRGLLFPNPETATNDVFEVVLGNFNTAAATNVAFEFDVAHANATGKADKLEIKVSKDCGATWATAWSKSGSALASAPIPAPNTAFVPTQGSNWRHETVVLTPYKSSNMVVKAVGTSNAGHYVFMDNLKITNTLAVPNVIANGSVALYPNPARESATLEFTLSSSSEVNVSVLDALGRTVSVVSNATLQQGAQRFTIPTSALAAGAYNITIRTEEGTISQRLSVVK